MLRINNFLLYKSKITKQFGFNIKINILKYFSEKIAKEEPKESKKVEKVVRVVREAKPKKMEIIEEEPMHHNPIEEDNGSECYTLSKQSHNQQNFYKPKSLKVLSAYEICKRDCQKKHNQKTTKEVKKILILYVISLTKCYFQSKKSFIQFTRSL